MLKRLLSFLGFSCETFQKKHESECAKKFREGYDWAAGALLRGELTVSEVENRTYAGDWVIEDARLRSFDRGAIAAVSHLVTVGLVVDDSLPEDTLENCK